MACIIETKELNSFIKSLLENNFPTETKESLKNAIGILQEKNNTTQYPTVEELSRYFTEARDISSGSKIIEYTPIGKPRQTYTIKKGEDGTWHIYNRKGEERFKRDNKDRRRIFANLAVKEGRAVVVTYQAEDKKEIFVVNKRDEIISVATGDLMKWEEKNDKRNTILELAKEKFNKLRLGPEQTIQTRFTTSINPYYSTRTKENADWSDITLALATDFNTAGEKLTKRVAGKKYISYKLEKAGEHAYDSDDILESIKENGLPTKNIKLNIAGNGIYTLRGWNQEELNDYLTEILQGLLDLGVTISEIRSGGQTGVDEAGIIAAQRLGIPNEVHTTSDYKFRDSSGKDTSDEIAFKNRFRQDQNSQGLNIQDLNTQEELTDILRIVDKNPVEDKPLNLDKIFNTPEITTIETYDKVDKLFDPQTRLSRVKLIARLFSNEVNKEQSKFPDKNRQYIIDNLTPGVIFKRVAKVLEAFTKASEQTRVNLELKNLESSIKSEDERLKLAQERASYKLKEFNKMIEDPEVFKALAEEAAGELVFLEGVVINPNYRQHLEETITNDDNLGEEIGGKWLQEETYKDGWMTNFRLVSSRDTLSKEVRALLSKMPKLDYNGEYEKDDLGFQKFLDADHVHAVLISKLGGSMIISDDMIPLLEELKRNNSWVEQLIEALQKDDILFSKFYHDLRRDTTLYWVQKKKMNKDGTFRMETIPVNEPGGISYLLNEWRGNIESGNTLTKNSLYSKIGEISKENSRLGLEEVNRLLDIFRKATPQEKLELINKDNNFNSIIELLHMVGVNTDSNTIKSVLSNIDTEPGVISLEDPIITMLGSLNVIFNGIIKDRIKTDEDRKRIDLIASFKNPYSNIANLISSIKEDVVEATFRENDKSYISNVNPSYLGKLIKNLRNVMKDEDRFNKFIKENYQSIEFFYQNGEWLNDALDQIVNNKRVREGLKHKVVLNSDKKEYTDWDSLDGIIALLTEYWGEPDSSKTDVHFGYFHVPILADAPSAEFLRLRKYKTGDILDDNGEPRTYDDIILDKLENLVIQEYNRIILVLDRHKKYKEGNSSIIPIANYDITEKNPVGGAEFKFLPALNNLIYKNQDGTSEYFLERLQHLKAKGTGLEVKNLIRNALSQIMEDGFEETYKEWEQIGLLETLENGNYKYLPFESQAKRTKIITQSLQRAKELLSELWTPNMEELLKSYLENKSFRTKEVVSTIEEIKSLLNSTEVSESELYSLSKNLEIVDRVKDALREYYWNSKLATSQIIQLTTTDLAYYKDLEDFQKRYKEIHAPSLRLNTKATFRGKNIGRKYERTIYLKDSEIISNAIEDIKVVLEEKVKNHEIDSIDKDFILSQFKKVNVADAQAYRSISSYRAIMGMSGQWTDEMESAYENFKSGNWNIKDFTTIWQTKKPFVYTQVNKLAGYHKRNAPIIDEKTGEQVLDSNGNPMFKLVDDTSKPIYIKVPIQNKNSEFLLLAMHQLISSSLSKSSKLKAINEFMEEYDIDVIQFESAVKVGKQGTIDLSNVDTEDEIKAKLLKDTGLKNGRRFEDDNVIHKIPYEDYGIQTATPEHIIDVIQLVGTQIRKLITADISDDAHIKINEEIKTKKEWLKLYNEIITENILQSFKEVDSMFKNPKDIEKILLDEIRSNSRYGKDLEEACTLDSNGNFNIPLFDPIQSNRVQMLLNSIIKGRITKQKINGGSLIQVSAYGLTDQLNIIFQDNEGNELSWESFSKENKNASREDFESFIKEKRKNGNLSIKCLECYMPAYSEKFYEPLMNPNTHVLDINKKNPDGTYILPEELRELIGYRVPTEDKYSMAPLRIKGFLPQQNGSAIMLPAEITTLSGSDFDVDKLYVMLPEFTIKEEIGWKQLVRIISENQRDWVKNILGKGNFKDGFSELQMIVDMIENGQDLSNSNNEEERTIYKFYKDNESKLKKVTIRKIKYNYNKSAKDNSLKARNNAMIDLMRAILTNTDTVSKILSPGNFEELKASANAISILRTSDEALLRNIFKEYELLFENKASLFKLPLKKLEKIVEKASRKLDPLSPITQIKLHQKNMVGGKMIGIYANHNASHALIQHTNLEIRENGRFKLDGDTLSSLHEIYGRDKKRISSITAKFLAASVDNVKYNVLDSLNQNTFTADASMLLARLGYNSTVIGLLMNQPIVLEITRNYFRKNRDGLNKEDAINEILKKYIKIADVPKSSYEKFKNSNFNINELAENIFEAANLESRSLEIKRNFYRNQVAVGYLFQKIMEVGEDLGKVVQATRADTQGGAAGPTIADTEIKIQKVDDLLKNTNLKSFTLNNADSIILGNLLLEVDMEGEFDEDTARKKLLDSPLPFLQAFYSLGVEETSRMLKPYFPQFTNSFKEVLSILRGYTRFDRLDVKTINSIYNDLFAYIMTKTPFFGSTTEINAEGNSISISSKDRRKGFIINFPSEFERIKQNNSDIASLEFIQKIHTVLTDKCPIPVLVFSNVGSLTPILRDRYIREWKSLLYMDNPEAHKLALNLFRYSFYRNGFAFGPNTFIHLAPVAVRRVIPDYLKVLRELTNTEDSLVEFAEQYVLNHLDNRRLVPKIPNDTSVSFVDDRGNPKEEITFDLDGNINDSDRTIIKKTLKRKEGNYYIVLNWICTDINGFPVYYMLNSNDFNKVTYIKVNPLGFKNNFIEYEYGKYSYELESVIPRGENPESDDNSTDDFGKRNNEDTTDNLVEKKYTPNNIPDADGNLAC